MTIFELVKLTLDELYIEGKVEHGADLDRRIIDKIELLKLSYTKLGSDDRMPVDYKDSATRIAYVYKYVAAHGDYMVQALEAMRANLGGHNIFSDTGLRLSCIGGGPGSDIIGILKYLSSYRTEPVRKITCYLLDKEQAWADTWTEVGDAIDSEASLNVNFQPFDVTDPDSWSAQKRFLKADLFTLNYFVSEVCKLDDGTVSRFWNKLLDEAHPGSTLIYVDNGHSTFSSYFDEHWSKRNDIEVVFRQDNTRQTLRTSEQKSELDVYRTKFKDFPKLQGQISTRILRKK